MEEEKMIAEQRLVEADAKTRQEYINFIDSRIPQTNHWANEPPPLCNYQFYENLFWALLEALDIGGPLTLTESNPDLNKNQ